MKKIIITLLLCLYSISAHAINTKYIPDNSNLVLSVDFNKIKGKTSEDYKQLLLDEGINFDFLNLFLDESVVASAKTLLIEDFGISKKNKPYLFYQDISKSAIDELGYNNNSGVYNENSSKVVGLLFGLDDSSKFERNMLGMDINVLMRKYNNYKVFSHSQDNSSVIFFNDEIALILFIDEGSNIDTLEYRFIAENIFSVNKKPSKKFEIFKKSKDDILLYMDTAILYEYLHDEFITSDFQELYSHDDYFTASLNFNKSDISLDVDMYSHNPIISNKELVNKLNKNLYKYARSENALGFLFSSINLQKIYEYFKEMGNKNNEYAEILQGVNETLIDELGVSLDDILNSFTGSIFYSTWASDLDFSMFENLSDEDKQFAIMLLSSYTSMGFGIFLDNTIALEISNDEAFNSLIEKLVAKEILYPDNIQGVDVYVYGQQENHKEDITEALQYLMTFNNVAIYREKNILYISRYKDVQKIIDGSYKPNVSKEIKTLTSKNSSVLYLDLQNILNIFGIYQMTEEDPQTPIAKLSSLDISSNFVGNNNSKTSIVLKLEGNEGNSIDWLLQLLFEIF